MTHARFDQLINDMAPLYREREATISLLTGIGDINQVVSATAGILNDPDVVKLLSKFRFFHCFICKCLCKKTAEVFLMSVSHQRYMLWPAYYYQNQWYLGAGPPAIRGSPNLKKDARVTVDFLVEGELKPPNALGELVL